MWLLLRTPGQRDSQDRARREEQASGNSLGSTEPDHLGSGFCRCQAGGQMAGAARVTPANGVASWLQRPGPRSRHQGQTQAGQLQTSPRAPPAQPDHKGSQQLAWCHCLAARGGFCGLPAALLSACPPPTPTPGCTWKAFHRAPWDQVGLSKTKETDHVRIQGQAVGAGEAESRRSIEEAAAKTFGPNVAM